MSKNVLEHTLHQSLHPEIQTMKNQVRDGENTNGKTNDSISIVADTLVKIRRGRNFCLCSRQMNLY